VVLHSARPSGAELAALEYMRRWKARVTVVLLENGVMADALKREGIDVRILDASRLSRVPRGAALLKRLELLRLFALGWRLGSSINGDLVMAHSTKSALVAFGLARRLSVPFVWSVHDILSRQYLGRLNSALTRLLVRRLADAVIVNSRTTMHSLGRRRRPILVRPPGVSLSAVSAGLKRTGSRTTVTIGMVGRLSPWKGQHLFVEAFAEEFGADEHVDAVILGEAMFGELDYRRGLEATIARSGLGHRMKLLGHVPNATARMGTLDILVHASILPEPFGAVIVEGMGAGLAVVAAAAGGPAETIKHGHDGLLFPPGDRLALRSAMRRLVDDVPLRRSLGQRAERTAALYDYDRLAELSEAWLRSVKSRRHQLRVTDVIAT
jgi:glycosyltransferase involved in cell wall biosynthesis